MQCWCITLEGWADFLLQTFILYLHCIVHNNNILHRGHVTVTRAAHHYIITLLLHHLIITLLHHYIITFSQYILNRGQVTVTRAAHHILHQNAPLSDTFTEQGSLERYICVSQCNTINNGCKSLQKATDIVIYTQHRHRVAMYKL